MLSDHCNTTIVCQTQQAYSSVMCAFLAHCMLYAAQYCHLNIVMPKMVISVPSRIQGQRIASESCFSTSGQIIFVCIFFAIYRCKHTDARHSLLETDVPVDLVI